MSGAPNIDPVRVRRLQWRCRRGMRELDQLFERRLAQLLAEGDLAGLDRFERLLACEDDQLWRWCMAREQPADAGLAAEIDAIRSGNPA